MRQKESIKSHNEIYKNNSKNWPIEKSMYCGLIKENIQILIMFFMKPYLARNFILKKKNILEMFVFVKTIKADYYAFRRKISLSQ